MMFNLMFHIAIDIFLEGSLVPLCFSLRRACGVEVSHAQVPWLQYPGSLYMVSRWPANLLNQDMTTAKLYQYHYICEYSVAV